MTATQTVTVRIIPAGTTVFLRPAVTNPRRGELITHRTITAVAVPENAEPSTEPALCCINGDTEYLSFPFMGYEINVLAEDTMIDTTTYESFPACGEAECYRCNGTGYIRHFSHVQNGQCFACGATGVVKVSVK